MSKKLTALFALVIILSFMVYMIWDASKDSVKPADTDPSETIYEESWNLAGEFKLPEGELKSVTVSEDGRIFLGGNSFVMALNKGLEQLWRFGTEVPVTALAVSGDTLFAATSETILLFTVTGDLIEEWGPYEGNSMITSVSASGKFVSVADAGNKRVFLLDRKGEVRSMMGQSDEKFIIPSGYFDIALSGNIVFAANTGNRRIEKWSTSGVKLSQFGEPGTAPDAFCGCCNPAHFAIIPQGFVTAEKGINRIKIIDSEGRFVEFVSAQNTFVQSIPLDVASVDGEVIYAANSADNTLYIYKHK